MEGQQVRQLIVSKLYAVVDRAKLSRDHYTMKEAEEAADELLALVTRLTGDPIVIDTRALHAITDHGQELVRDCRTIPNQPLLSIMALEQYMRRMGRSPNFVLFAPSGAK